MGKHTVPSHLNTSQAGRYLGVSQTAVTQRNQRGEITAVVVFGVKMFSTDDLRRWKREILKRRGRRAVLATEDASA